MYLTQMKTYLGMCGGVSGVNILLNYKVVCTYIHTTLLNCKVVCTYIHVIFFRNYF